MVKKIDLKQNTKVKQKQNVNVRVHIDQRNTKKKPQKKRNNRPSAKREGVSSFSSGFTPVYIQSGNPYPIPSNPDATPIKASVEQQKVPSLVNPPSTSTTNINEEVRKKVKEVFNERDESNSMGIADINVAFKRLPNNIQNSIKHRVNNNTDANDMDIGEINSNNVVAQPREKRKYTKKNEFFWASKKFRKNEKDDKDEK